MKMFFAFTERWLWSNCFYPASVSTGKGHSHDLRHWSGLFQHEESISQCIRWSKSLRAFETAVLFQEAGKRRSRGKCNFSNSSRSCWDIYIQQSANYMCNKLWVRGMCIIKITIGTSQHAPLIVPVRARQILKSVSGPSWHIHNIKCGN